VQIGLGFGAYAESANGTVSKEHLSMIELLDHELTHALAVINGEEVHGDAEP
jgi:hypothetical protein